MSSAACVPGSPAAEGTGVVAGIAGWACRISADTPQGERYLLNAFGDHRPTGRPAVVSEILLQSSQPEPVLTVLRGAEALDVGQLLSGPDWKRFQPVTWDGRPCFTDEVFGPEPAFELTQSGVRVVRRERTGVYLQAVYGALMIDELAPVLLHAATVAAGGSTLLLIGDSKAGKSTLCWALQSIGAEYFSDESAVFTPPGFELYVTPRPLCLRPGALSCLGGPEPAGQWYEAIPGDPKLEVFVPPSDRECPRERVQLLFVDGFAEKPALTEMPGGEAARRVLRSMRCRPHGIIERLELAADLVSRYPCRRLKIGSPHETADLLLRSVGARS
jgi:hypothetical protein